MAYIINEDYFYTFQLKSLDESPVRADGTNGERNERRENDDCFSFDLNRVGKILHQRCMMTLPKPSLYTRFWCSFLSSYLSNKSFWLSISLYLSFYETIHVHNLKGPDGIVYLGIFFCKVTLSMANCKACPVNNLPLGKYCLKSILHDSLASFYHIRRLQSRKIFPTHCQKALNKGK